MKKNNDNDKNLIDLQPGGQKTPGEFESQSHIVFAQRVALADDKTRSRYNAVKNAFMGYSAPDKGLHVTCTVDVYGEAFTSAPFCWEKFGWCGDMCDFSSP